jgi:hypothetical protein
MTTEQLFFYGVATITGVIMWAVAIALMAVKDWKKVGQRANYCFQMCWMAAAFAVVVVPVYVLTRLVDGVSAFFDAAFPELTGLVYRVRHTARDNAVERLASWNKSIAYDRDTHRQKMAEFDGDEGDDESEYATSSEKAYGGDW